VVRGFVSRIDDSVQPYGVVVPENWRPGGSAMRLDVWLAGRDERRTELKFISERLRSKGEFTPTDTVVVHPYGRFCNAYKFAGETDVFEAVAQVERAYGTDSRRRAIRGFSMGGAGTWHLAAHYPGFWRAAAPGAGFADTATYTGVLKKEPQPPAWEQTLWQLYDVPGYAANFHQLDLIAYSGELDPQKLAADTMAAAMLRDGMTMRHIIGPGVQHRYEPGAKAELARQFDALMATPKDTAPRRVEFTTSTARYPDGGRLAWFALEHLRRHWEQAHVIAEVAGDRSINVIVTNVTSFRLVHPPGVSAGDVEVRVNRQTLRVRGRAGTEGGFEAGFVMQGAKWRASRLPVTSGKRPGSQGPIDDAFMDRFLVVRPTAKAWNQAVADWADTALKHFVADWRAQFRGDLRIKDDTEVTDADLADSNLILWGDPGSNRLLARIVRRLPVRWTRRQIHVGQQTFDPATQVPAFICPNPLNPERYVVVNSGHTFAAWNGTNARQTPRLPDWAVFSLTGPEGSEVAAAGFFDEAWQAR
jgi:hypothetical protein